MNTPQSLHLYKVNKQDSLTNFDIKISNSLKLKISDKNKSVGSLTDDSPINDNVPNINGRKKDHFIFHIDLMSLLFNDCSLYETLEIKSSGASANDVVDVLTDNIDLDGLVCSCKNFISESINEFKNEPRFWFKSGNKVPEINNKLTNFRYSVIEELYHPDPKSMKFCDHLHHLSQYNNLFITEQKSFEQICSFDKIVIEKVKEQLYDIEFIDYGALFYRQFFIEHEHSNYFGIDEYYGPIAISIRKLLCTNFNTYPEYKSKHDEKEEYQYYIIARNPTPFPLRISVHENSIICALKNKSSIKSSKGIPVKDVVQFILPNLQINSIKQACQTPTVFSMLEKIDELSFNTQYKIGVIYCSANQQSEEEMYNNEAGSDAFYEFMNLLSTKIRLKDFEGFKGQLDTKNDNTGTHSYHTIFKNREIMFHVSTLLPFSTNNSQQLARKRHIGNDIVTIIFQEPGSLPFSPKTFRSHFQHVFIIVRLLYRDGVPFYKVAVTRAKDVPYFGPKIIPHTLFGHNLTTREFLLTKIVNAENASFYASKFLSMTQRTRGEYIKDLYQNHTTGISIDKESRSLVDMFILKKDKFRYNFKPEIVNQYALVWDVYITTPAILRSFHKNNSTGITSLSFVRCRMAIAPTVVSFINKESKECFLSIFTCNIVAYKLCASHSIRLYYNIGDCIILRILENELEELQFILSRLRSITNIAEVIEGVIRNGSLNSLQSVKSQFFHVGLVLSSRGGLVLDVDQGSVSWQAGLRKGYQILEIDGYLTDHMPRNTLVKLINKFGNKRFFCVQTDLLKQIPWRLYSMLSDRYQKSNSIISIGSIDSFIECIKSEDNFKTISKLSDSNFIRNNDMSDKTDIRISTIPKSTKSDEKQEHIDKELVDLQQCLDVTVKHLNARLETNNSYRNRSFTDRIELVQSRPRFSGLFNNSEGTSSINLRPSNNYSKRLVNIEQGIGTGKVETLRAFFDRQPQK